MDEEEKYTEIPSAMPPRKNVHRRPPFSWRKVFEKMFGSLRLNPEIKASIRHEPLRKPSEIEPTSRNRLRRRKRRLRLRRHLRMVKITKRITYTTLIVCAVVVVTFWAKFAIVYHVPSFMQTGKLQSASAYLVVKSWWFGPTFIDLNPYVQGSLSSGNLAIETPIQSLVGQLGNYQDIVTNHKEILFVWQQ